MNDHGHAADPLPMMPRPVVSVLHQQIERDLALLATMTFRCADPECGRCGPAHDGNWFVVKVGTGVLTYCSGCAAAGGGS